MPSSESNQTMMRMFKQETILVIVLLPLLSQVVLLTGVTELKKSTIDYLIQYRYLNETQDEPMLIDPSEALATFQEHYGLEVDGLENNETLKLLSKPRCGVSDYPNFHKIRQGWKKSKLTWYYGHLPSLNVLPVIEKAFSVWGAVANLTFTKAIETPDVMISFLKLDHSNHKRCMQGECLFSFDGEGTVLGHAYFPETNNKNSCREVHLDLDENWYYGVDDNVPKVKISLSAVLIHEIGHVLGLEHSSFNTSLMAPFYSKSIHLSQDHIDAVQNLYGRKPNKKITTTTTTPTTTTTKEPEVALIYDNTNICNIDPKDLLFLIQGKTKTMYIIHKNRIWILNLDTKKFTTTKGWFLDTFLRSLPPFEKMTAIYQRPSGEIVVIIKDELFMIDDTNFRLTRRENITRRFGRRVTGAVNTYSGRTFYFFDEDYHVEIDECSFGILGASAFYQEELQKVKHPDVYLVEKILRRKGNKVYVKWLEMDTTHGY